MTTYYLNADTGDDTTGDGSSGNPWETLGKAETEHTSGDVWILQNATAVYTMGQVLTFDGVTIRGESQAGVTVDRSNNGHILECAAGSTNTVEDLTWTHSTGTYTIGGALRVGDTSTLVVNNVIFDTFGSYSWEYSDSNGTDATTTYTSCVFKDLFCPIFRSIFEANAYTTTGQVINFNNCLFFWTDADVVILHTEILRTNTSSALTQNFNNCCFYSERSALRDLADSAVQSNWVFSNCNSYAVNGWTDPPTGTDMIELEPGMIDAAAGNYNLRPSSPQIDAGVLI